MTSTLENCRRCARPMVPRGGECPPGVVQHGARNLCRGCHGTVARNGNLDDFPPYQNPNAHMIEDFHFIAESSGGRRTNTAKGWDKSTRIHAAARLGVNVLALDRALERDAVRRAA